MSASIWPLRVDDWSDLANPAIVKDLRQGLRRRIFWISFSLALLACLAVSVGIWLDVRDGNGAVNGATALNGYLFVIAAVQFFLVPFTAFQNLRSERNGQGWALLTLSGLGARRILHGKLLAYALQASLYASAAVPFLVFSYYLNGVDLLQLLGVVVLGGAWCVLMLSGALFAGTMGLQGQRDRMVEGISGFFAFVGLFFGSTTGYGIVLGASAALATHPRSYFAGLLALTWSIAGMAMVTLELGVDFLSRVTERDARAHKYKAAAFTLASGILAAIIWGYLRA